jgi:hypothetical protein
VVVSLQKESQITVCSMLRQADGRCGMDLVRREAERSEITAFPVVWLLPDGDEGGVSFFVSSSAAMGLSIALLSA